MERKKGGEKGRREGGREERRAHCRVVGGEEESEEGGKRGNVPRCQLFSRSVCARTPKRGEREGD